MVGFGLVGPGDRRAGAPLRRRPRRALVGRGLRRAPHRRPTRPSSRTYLRTGRRLRFVCSVGRLRAPAARRPGGRPVLAVRPLAQRPDRRLHGRLAVGGAVALPVDAGATRAAPLLAPPARGVPAGPPAVGPAAGRRPRQRPRARRGRGRPSRPTVRITVPGPPIALAGIAVAAIVEAAQRWILRRPQPFVAQPTSSRRTTRCGPARSTPSPAAASQSLLLVRSGRRSSLADSDVPAAPLDDAVGRASRRSSARWSPSATTSTGPGGCGGPRRRWRWPGDPPGRLLVAGPALRADPRAGRGPWSTPACSRPGTRLPSIRQLAGDLGLAGGTVARAYRELEQEGVVATRGRHGTVVAEPVGGPARGARHPRRPAGPGRLRAGRGRAAVGHRPRRRARRGAGRVRPARRATAPGEAR